MTRKEAEALVNRLMWLVQLNIETRIAHNAGLYAVLPDSQQEALQEQERLRARLIEALVGETHDEG